MPLEINAIKQRVGFRVRYRGDEIHAKQDQLAYDAKLSTTYLSQIENGKSNLSLARMLLKQNYLKRLA